MTVYTVTYKKRSFSSREVRDIVVSVITLSVALFFIVSRSKPVISLLDALGISFLMTITAFLFHEMSHKFTAIHYGAWSEFRMWPLGLLLTIVTGFLGFLFALPGAVYFASYRNPIREGKIAIAGPSANLVIGVILLPVLLFAHLGSLARVDIYYLTYINIWLGFFNLIPIPPLDGSKVFAWDRRNWAVIFAIAAALVVYFFLFL